MTTISDGTRQSIAAGALTYDLGQFILNGIPYQYDATSEPVLVTGGQGFAPDQLNVVKDGPAQLFGENPGENPARLPPGDATQIDLTSPASEAQIRANPFQSIWWYFATEPHRVTKAMRIAYTVKQGGVEVTKHILIGYEGVDPQG